MPPKVVITFEGILLLIRKIVLHLMVDSTVSPFAKEYQREQWLFALVFVSLYWNRGFSDEWIPSQAD